MTKIQAVVLNILITSGMLAITCPLAIAADSETPDYIKDTSDIGQAEDGYIRSEQLLELGSPTPGALTLEGEQSLRQGSLKVFQRSVELAPGDIDARTLYAQTLEKKLMAQKGKKDPALYNFIIKQWLFIYLKSEYFDQKMEGLSHVIELTGTQPKRFEREQKFLSRVLIPEDGSVKVIIGGEKNKGVRPKIAKKDDLDKDFKKDNLE
jgi:hypothetical protein